MAKSSKIIVQETEITFINKETGEYMYLDGYSKIQKSLRAFFYHQ